MALLELCRLLLLRGPLNTFKEAKKVVEIACVVGGTVDSNSSFSLSFCNSSWFIKSAFKSTINREGSI